MNIPTFTKATPRQKLKTIMALKEITQADIARQIGMTRQGVNHILSGHVKSLLRRVQVCDALGIKYSDIWD